MNNTLFGQRGHSEQYSQEERTNRGSKSWTCRESNPGAFACEANVIPLHHKPHNGKSKNFKNLTRIYVSVYFLETFIENIKENIKNNYIGK